MNKTKIEYLTHTWNPIAMRCTPVSTGCANCWHLGMANRLAGNQAFPPEVRDAYDGEGPPVLIKYRLNEPLRRKKPATIGVQFMGDLFHKRVPDTYIRSVFGTIIDCPQHKFLILTKRPDEALNFLRLNPQLGGRFPDNVYLGVTAENQATADERIPLLLQTPAAVRFVSCEPLLGPLNLRRYLPELMDGYDLCGFPTLSWCIVGGESGPGARPMDVAWARSLRDQCQASGTPYFYKQHGAWLHESQTPKDIWGTELSSRFVLGKEYRWPDGTASYRVGKRAAGRLLDGRTWDEQHGRCTRGTCNHSGPARGCLHRFGHHP